MILLEDGKTLELHLSNILLQQGGALCPTAPQTRYLIKDKYCEWIIFEFCRVKFREVCAINSFGVTWSHRFMRTNHQFWRLMLHHCRAAVQNFKCPHHRKPYDKYSWHTEKWSNDAISSELRHRCCDKCHHQVKNLFLCILKLTISLRLIHKKD